MKGARAAVPEDLKGLSLDEISWCIKKAYTDKAEKLEYRISKL